MYFWVLFWILIYNFDNVDGNYRSLLHGSICTFLNLYILMFYLNEITHYSLDLTFSYMISDIFFILMDNSKSKVLYIIHHIGVLVAISIIIDSKNLLLYSYYPYYALLGEITNIPLQIYYLTKNKLIYHIFNVMYVSVRFIILPIFIHFIYYKNTEVFIISCIAYCFIIVSIVWFYYFLF